MTRRQRCQQRDQRWRPRVRQRRYPTAYPGEPAGGPPHLDDRDSGCVEQRVREIDAAEAEEDIQIHGNDLDDTTRTLPVDGVEQRAEETNQTTLSSGAFEVDWYTNQLDPRRYPTAYSSSSSDS